jgi:polysaccharide pyruvyl transferase WcaK-like protein
VSGGGGSAVIIGVYGKGNFGDEALLETVVDDIHSLLPQCTIHVFCSGPDSVAERFGFHALSRTPATGFLEKLALVRRSRLVMVGGGTLLCDHRGPLDNARVVFTYFFWLWLAKLCGVPTLVYGQGFGPATSRIIRLGMWLTRFSCDAVTVRDSASYELLVGIAGKRPKFALGADPVVAADRFLPARVRQGVDDQFAARIAELQPFVLLAIRNPKLTSPEDCRGYFDAFGEAAARILHHTKSGVVLFPAHLSDPFEDDRPIMDSVRLLVPEHHHHGPEDDGQVEPQRPVAQVVEVVLDALAHVLEVLGLAAVAVDLREPRDAGRTLWRSM